MVILWDLDGTIQDSERLAKEGTRHGFRTVLGRDPTEDEFAQLVGKPVPVVYRQWFGDELGSQILDVGSGYYKEHLTVIRCYDGIPELLSELHRRGFRMGIVSSKRREFIFAELHSQGFEGLFEVIVGQEDTTLHKPHPDPLAGSEQARCVACGLRVHWGSTNGSTGCPRSRNVLHCRAVGRRHVRAITLRTPHGNGY